MTDDQIKHMVNRFLQWRLPDDFAPDAGIRFDPVYNVHASPPLRHEPVGTNLFSGGQAEAMVRYMVEGMASVVPMPPQIYVTDMSLAHVFTGVFAATMKRGMSVADAVSLAEATTKAFRAALTPALEVGA